LGVSAFVGPHVISVWGTPARVLAIETARTEEGEAAKNERAEILDALKVLVGKVDGVITQQEEFKGLILTPIVTGRATVGDFGSDTAFVDINEDGQAKMYLGAEQISITVSDQQGISHEIAFDVRGSFRNQRDPGHLIMFSVRAADDLGVSGIVDKVTVGPVGK